MSNLPASNATTATPVEATGERSWDGQCLRLGALGGAIAVCSNDGVLEGATDAARALLTRLNLVGPTLPCALPKGFWTELSSAPVGEPVEWRSPDNDACLGCTRYVLGTTHSVLLMRDVSTKQRVLSNRLHQQRLEAVGLLATTLAHDLRAALSAVVFNVDVLSTRGSTLPVDEQKQCLDEIGQASRRLTRTVDELLDFARIGPPMFSDISVRASFERASGLIRPVIRRGGHTVEAHIDPAAAWVKGNPLIVEQVLVALLTNAGEASQSPLKIEVRAVPCTAIEGGQIEGSAPMTCISVTDNGPGIPDELRDKIFDPFFTTKSRGTGLGLTTAREAAWQLGGDLRLIRSPNGGASFALVLVTGSEPADPSLRNSGAQR